ncbi:hypothetical protein Cst04h_03260 [Corynebacterium striatum]|uniref:Uncharacterized protein n=1 Tax=Corynebacterium striatum TaxID=43770 RepID=A0ABC9ZJU5_CORST|nr:hypothetical protein Cst04h_03260 [Corynebacterium striatum]
MPQRRGIGFYSLTGVKDWAIPSFQVADRAQDYEAVIGNPPAGEATPKRKNTNNKS